MLVTYGEAWYEQKLEEAEKNFNEFNENRRLICRPRMSRKDAVEYYRNKSRKVFKSLGYAKKEIPVSFEVKLEKAFLIERKKTNAMLKREVRSINSIYHLSSDKG